MNRVAQCLCLALVLVVSMYSNAHASVIEFSNSITSTWNIDDAKTTPYSYTVHQYMDFSPPIHDIIDAKLTLNYSGVNNSNGPNSEAWIVDVSSGTKYNLGQLSGTGNSFSANIPSGIFSSIAGSTWLLEIIFTENTPGTDKFQLLSSTVSGHYNAVDPVATPEPGTMILMGAGMIGTTLMGRRMRRGKV